MPPHLDRRRRAGWLALTLVTTLAVVTGTPARVAARPARTQGRWLKGELHAHSARSGDSRTPPEAVLRWYGERGFDFVIFTDHNQITDFRGRVPGAGGRVLALPGVELTRNPPSCTDGPAAIPSAEKCHVHMNTLLPRRLPGEIPWADGPASDRRVDLYQRQIDTGRALGGLVMLNHPTWRWGVGVDLARELAGRGARLFEVANANFDEWNAGTPGHASAEALWDAALTAGVDVWGVAADDGHHYDDAGPLIARGERCYPAAGYFVMVRAHRNAAAIRRALEQGDFYASTGVVLADVVAGPTALVVRAAAPDHHFVFIGAGGSVLAESDGSEASFDLGRLAPGGYVRAVVIGPEGRKAWVQPVRRRR